MKIRKAIIPVAGLGTRFLPASKAQPKEMLAVVDKPVIQYIVEEAVASGIEEIIFVTAIGKRAIEDHFDRNFELEYRLEQKGKKKELEEIAAIGKLAKFAFVRQGKPMGDGHAILAALPFIERHEPVAVIFGDAITDAKVPGLKQLMNAYDRYTDPIVGVTRIPKEEISGYGVIDGKEVGDRLYEISRFVEKPSVAEAPSNMAVMGQYILTPEVLEILKTQEPGKGGEIRLADALITHLKNGKSMYGVDVDGTWHDCGSKLGFLIAQIELGLKHPEIGKELKRYLKGRT
ncbi:UTP--glucose-1-phosphate uridylyltransferase GalU [Candidatus Uhrbacteria bacterium]|nr:UTP--glucose-1-phosphate uridylyltransferase GalU [Candidatus Uhrbacteria bacterium]